MARESTGCRAAGTRYTVTRRNITSGGKRKEDAERQQDGESYCVLGGREKFVCLSLSDRTKEAVTEGGEGRGKMCQSENRQREMNIKKQNESVYECCIYMKCENGTFSAEQSDF